MKFVNIFVLAEFTLFVFGIKSALCGFVTSTDSLRQLFDHESDILATLLDVLSKVTDLKEELHRKLISWKDEHESATMNIDSYVNNPLNAFLMVKRNVIDFNNLKSKFKAFIEDFQLDLHNIDQKTVVETKELTEVVTSILRLQETYHLKSEDLVEGNIDGGKTRKPFEIHDIFVLAEESFNIKNQMFFAKSYFEILDEKLKSFPAEQEINSMEIKNKLQEFNNITIINPWEEYLNISDAGSVQFDRTLSLKVCRGDIERSPKETEKFKCRFASFSPFSTISQFKLEEISFEPYIVIYHEILSESEVDELIKFARPIREKAEIYTDAAEENNDIRFAEVAWLDDEIKIVTKLNKRFEDMTGLTMKGSEELQVQNYGVGGHFHEHYDHEFERTDPGADDRVATILFYVGFKISLIKFRINYLSF